MGSNHRVLVYLRNLRPYKVAFLNSSSQNEHINLIDDEFRKLIAKKKVSENSFAVVMDSTPDKSHRGQILLVNRYVNEKFDIKERLAKMSEIKVSK